MLYIVDGTGPFFDSDYSVSMAGSHCAVLHHLNRTQSFYFRGPDLMSAIKTTGGTADKVVQRVLQEEFPPALLAPGQQQRPKSKIFLAGHSRGGAAVVRVAQLLAQQGIAVEAMFLFDAVDRTLTLDVETVPSTVKRCFHAVRNPGAQIVMAHETGQLWKACTQAPGYAELQSEHRRIGSGGFEAFLVHRSAAQASQWPALARAVRAWRVKQQTLQRMSVAMRNAAGVAVTADGGIEASIAFGNCATRFASPCQGETAEFACSHGAIGGTPWLNLGDEIAQLEREGAGRVWTWMASRLLGCGLRAGAA